MAETKFDAAWWDIWSMRRQANKIAEEEGLRTSNDKDSFRHAYSTAQVADKFNMEKPVQINFGNGVARTLGAANEILAFSNTAEDHFVDLRNNEIGLQILGEVEREVERRKATEGLDENHASLLKEELLREKIADAVRAGQMGQKPFRNMDAESDADRLLTHTYKRNK